MDIFTMGFRQKLVDVVQGKGEMIYEVYMD